MTEEEAYRKGQEDMRERAADLVKPRYDFEVIAKRRYQISAAIRDLPIKERIE